MAIIKCKMCGADLALVPDSTVAECEYCRTVQTVPSADNEKKLTLFARANRLRMACEFDKAAGVYEAIVADFPEDAEAYWGLVLCKYGIEYVNDPGTGKKVPTCHRSSFDSVMDDANFDLALENADAIARKVYRDEAKQIEEIRKGIIAVSSKEDPYDIFICYKETDINGDRTLDSVLAQDIYNALTEKGYRVFFSRITLEDKLGQEYEPYIFAALNSAKVMLAVGTDYEHYNAVWVKNEWSRFLRMISAGQKKTLIPCYKNIDAYDMPKEFAKLQAQDLGKIGALQDLIRGVEKLIGKITGDKTSEYAASRNAASIKVNNLVELGFAAVKTGEIHEAKEHFQAALAEESNHIGACIGMIRISEDAKKSEPYMQKLICYEVVALKKYLCGNCQYLTSGEAPSLLTQVVSFSQSFELVKTLIEAGCKPADEPWLLQHAIVKWDDFNVIKLLVEQGVDVNWEWQIYEETSDGDIRKTENRTALEVVLYYDHKWDTREVVSFLLKNGANPNHIYKRMDQCFGDFQVLQDTPLTWALKMQDMSMVKLLLENGADPNQDIITESYSNSSRSKITLPKEFSQCVTLHVNPLRLAITYFDDPYDVVKLLLEHKANPNYQYKSVLHSGKAGDDSYVQRVASAIELSTGLSDALLYTKCYEKVAMLLLEAGANPNSRYELMKPNWRPNQTEGCNVPVLDIAITLGSESVAKKLLSSGATFDSEVVSYSKGEDYDRFKLAQRCYSDLSSNLISLIRQYGWKGSKKTLFSSAHYPNYCFD